MFFIGATGQLLTLILTVSLPFMLLVSGQGKIEIQNSVSFFETENISNIEIVSDNLQVAPDTIIVAVAQKLPVLFENTINIKHPFKKIRVKWKTFCLNNSGNKAPPVFI